MQDAEPLKEHEIAILRGMIMEYEHHLRVVAKWNSVWGRTAKIVATLAALSMFAQTIRQLVHL